MIPTLLKQRLRQNYHFGRLASIFRSMQIYADLWSENALDWCNANKFTNKDQSVSAKCMESSQYQVFTRVCLSIYSHFDIILNEDQLKCNSYKSFKQLSVLWYCLICRIFSEEDLSCEEIDIYVKLFLSACNAFSKAVIKWKKGEKGCSKKWRKHVLFINNNLFSVYVICLRWYDCMDVWKNIEGC